MEKNMVFDIVPRNLVDPIAAMFNGVCNESANLATTFILARENGMLDEEKYFAAT